MLLFPLAVFCLYQMVAVRKNKFSGRKEFKFINRPFELYCLGPFISRRIKASYKNVIYKQESEECKQVRKNIDRLIEENNLRPLMPFLDVKLIHDQNTVALYLNLDQTLYITIGTL